MKYFPYLVVFVTSINFAVCQPKFRKLPPSINHPSINVYAPYMSFDGDALLFLSDNAEDYNLTPVYTFRSMSSGWKEPAPLPKNLNTRLNYIYGYTLGPTGRTLFLSSMKSPGVGGYDLLMSEWNGTAWSEPKNLAAPINSKSNEASASLSPDGKALYFMRCEKMTQTEATGCKIWLAQKQATGLWGEPVELPAIINTGNSQTPRIMADGETLIFSSDKFPDNKGGMDLYVTKKQNGQWGQPRALAFANTAGNDQHVSVRALGRYLVRDEKGERKSEIVEHLIPKELRPKGLMKVEGVVTADGSGATLPAYVSVLDLTTGKRVFNGRPDAEGNFTVYLTEGSRYELSVDPEASHINFFSKVFDLTADEIPQSEKIKVALKPLAKGDELSLNQVTFKPSSASLDQSSHNDLLRLSRVMKANPDLSFEVQVMLIGYEESIDQTNPDLTELIETSTTIQVDDIDSLGQLYKRGSIVTQVIYHNDRTEKQARAILDYLLEQGVQENRLTYFVNARPEAVEEKRKVLVTVRAK